MFTHPDYTRPFALPAGVRRLVFVERDDRDATTWRDPDATAVGSRKFYFYSASNRPMVWLDSLTSGDLSALHDEYNTRYALDPDFLDDFREWMTTEVLIRENEADDISYCCHCADPLKREDAETDKDGDTVCDACIGDKYTKCDDCGEWEVDEKVRTIGNDSVCDSCSENYYWCERCDMSYHPDDDNHYHGSEDCGCEPDTKTVTLRLGPDHTDDEGNGDTRIPGVLSADESLIIELPSDTISDHGLYLVERLLHPEVMGDTPRRIPNPDHDPDRVAAYFGDNADTIHNPEWTRRHHLLMAVRHSSIIGNQWKTDKGTLPKRIERHFYNEGKIKFSKDTLARVGTIARDNSLGGKFDVTVTRDLNGSAHEFGHSESCWWTDYAEGRCAFKTNGGFGLRAWETDRHDRTYCIGRAWVIGVRFVKGGTFGGRWVPTYGEHETPDAYVLFNSYGVFEERIAARVFASMTGWSHRSISFSAEHMYVNGDSAFLFTPNADDFAETSSMYLDTDQHGNTWGNDVDRDENPEPENPEPEVAEDTRIPEVPWVADLAAALTPDPWGIDPVFDEITVFDQISDAPVPSLRKADPGYTAERPVQVEVDYSTIEQRASAALDEWEQELLAATAPHPAAPPAEDGYTESRPQPQWSLPPAPNPFPGYVFPQGWATAMRQNMRDLWGTAPPATDCDGNTDPNTPAPTKENHR